MSEELKSEQELVVLPIEEQISQELVKANVTDAVIESLRDRYLPLSIENSEDKKETYLLVKEGRKECKSIRIMASKICKKGRESAVKIQKAWIKTEDDVTGRISEVEDYLEKQEVAYDAEVAKEKEARKRKQEEQLITRQQTLAAMGVLYSDGNFSIGEVSFELSLIKESEEDVWQEAILPKFKEEYEKVQAEQIELKRKEQEKAEEFKRQQEELGQKKKELAEEAIRLQQEADRQKLEADKRRSILLETRTNQVTSLGFVYNGIEYYKFREYTILLCDIHQHCDADWNGLIADAGKYVEIIKAEEAEEKRKEQEIKELQNKRYAELYPYAQYSYPVAMDSLWQFSEDKYLGILEGKKAAFQKAEEDRNRQIAEAAAKEERERIEEEQRQSEVKRKKELKASRIASLYEYGGSVYAGNTDDLGEMPDDEWFELITKAKESHEELIRKQKEDKAAEELLQASEKEKWQSMMLYLEGMIIHSMRSSQYRKKVSILKEKLEEIKSL